VNVQVAFNGTATIGKELLVVLDCPVVPEWPKGTRDAVSEALLAVCKDIHLSAVGNRAGPVNNASRLKSLQMAKTST
jgi:hypothetical protein